MLNNYAEAGGGFNSSHGQTSRPPENQKQQNLGSSWSYNGQLEGMYYGSDHQPVFMGPYEGSTKHSNYSQYPTGTIHQPVPTPVVKCHEACCQHFQDRYPLNPAPLRYQPSGPVQPRYADLANSDSRQYFPDRRSLSRKKVYSAENGYPAIPDRHFSQYMGRGQLHVADSRQQMQMMRSQYPMYPSYWSSARGWTAPRVNCPPPPSYHQSINQGAQLQAGLKMADGNHYIDPTVPKSMSTQHRRGITSGSGGPEIIRPIPESKRSSLDPNLQSCYEFGYPTGFVPFSEVNKIQGSGIGTQSSNASCKIPNDKQYHPHQMQYSMQGSDRNMMNCSNAMNDLSYPINFPMPGNDSYLRPGMEEGQQIPDTRKLPLQYDSSLGKKRPDLDLRQYLATWEDDEEENTRLSEPLLGNNGAPYIVVDCRSLEGEAATKLQERYKTPSSQNCSSKTRSNSPTSGSKRTEDQSGQGENFPPQTSYAPSMPTLISDSEKNMNFWNGNNREGDSIIGKGGAFQPLDCSKRDGNLDPNAVSKRPSHPNNEMSTHKTQGPNDASNMSFDALVSYYGDNRRMVDGNCDFVEMTERLVNISEKSSTNNRNPLDHQLPSEITRPCDPRLQQSQLGNNPSIYNKMTPRYPTNNFQHFKPSMPADPYYNYKHPMSTSKYFGYDNPQMVDPNHEYHKIASDFDNARLFNSKDISKDPRRMFHQEVDKSVESSFLDPMRKAQISDCFQDKSSLEFAAVDPDQFISPMVIKKSELDNRDKTYSEKNSAIRERMEVINGENQNHAEKTVLITSQNGPPEIFRVPFSPEKESLKDNMVTLHSGDQTKSNTITVEVPVPYVQQYSTLVKLSEEISRAEKDDGKTGSKDSDLSSSKKSSHEEFKKPTSFKLKRLPNSKEWAVEGKDCSEINRIELAETSSATAESSSSSCEVSGERDVLKSNVAVSNLNMPSLDDIRDGDENCDENQSKSKLVNEALSSNKTITNCDEVSKNKYSAQTPQMAIVQPMKLTQSENEQSNSDLRKLPNDDCKETSISSSLSTVNLQNMNQISFDSDKMGPNEAAHLQLMTESDISKHENFRTHKKIQSSFTNSISNCLSSPNEDFLHPQDGVDPKEPFSPFQVYSDCDMNAQITDYFKIDERTATGEKILDGRMPSSPGVEGMFEDINHSNQNQLFQSKSCNFQDLTDPNLSSLSGHNSHFQSFSSIFSDEIEKSGRSDGSVLQMNEKKYLKHIFDDIENHEISKSLNERVAELEPDSLNKKGHDKSGEVEKSPPIPPISLKLNETKKIWCIANKHQPLDESNSSQSPSLIPCMKHTDTHQETFGLHSVNELKNELVQAIHKETEELYSENYVTEIETSVQTTSSEKSTKDFDRNEEKRDLTQFLFNDRNKQNLDQAFPSTHLTVVLPDKSLTENVKRVQEECMSNSKYANKCLSLIKYNPRIKVLEKIMLINKFQSITSGSLVFDEKGRHFPKQFTEEIPNRNESMFIVKDILDLVITRAVHHKEGVKIDGVADNFYKQWSTPEIKDVRNTMQTVIKFDSSRNQNLMEIKEQENCIAKTTEMFIQHEKENCQHYSVIKTVTSENTVCNVNEKKKTIRSIFSPMSENGDEDDGGKLDSPNIKNYVKKMPFQEEEIHIESVQNDYVLNVVEIDNTVDYSLTTAQTSCKEDVPLNMSPTKNLASTQKIILNGTVSNIIEDEEFKGFGSPKIGCVIEEGEITNDKLDHKMKSNCEIDCANNEEVEIAEYKLDHKMKSNCEIDDALELMGLSNVEPLEQDSEKNGNENEPEISLTQKPVIEKSLGSLQESLESNVSLDKCFFQNSKNDIISADIDLHHEDGEISLVNKSKALKHIVDPIVKEYEVCDENKISNLTQDTDHCLTPDILNNSCETNKSEHSMVINIKTNDNQSHCLNSCEPKIQETKINSIQKSFNFGDNDHLQLSSENSPDKSLECEMKEIPTNTNDCQTPPILPVVLEEQSCSQEKSLAEAKFVEMSSSFAIYSSSLQDTDITENKEYIEDFEARLETSVIVRNSSCSGIKLSESSEFTTVCEQSVLSNSSKTRVSTLETEESCSPGSFENERNICNEKDIKISQNDLGSSNTRGNVLVDNNENCSSQFTKEENTPTCGNNIHSLQMDCEPNFSSNNSMTFPDQIDCSVNFENHNLDVEIKLDTEHQSSHTNQTSVITSKYCEPNSSLSPETTVEVCRIEKPCYCVGESIFLWLSEETKTSVKDSKTSYYYEFKKRKWQKFSKSLNSKLSWFDNYSNVSENCQERDCTVINFNTRCNDLLEECITKNTGCCLVNENGQEMLNNTASKSLEDNLKLVPKVELDLLHCSANDQSTPTKLLSSTKEKLTHLENGYEHAKQNVTECSIDSLTSEKDHSNAISTKDSPVPLKVKSSLFTSNETNNCFVKRDSLKNLEPEAVFKEIFSSDPETDDSESKENECPENLLQEKLGNPSQQVDLVLRSSIVSTFLPNSTSNQCKLNDFDFCSQISNKKENLQKSTDHCDSSSLSCIDPNFNENSVNPRPDKANIFHCQNDCVLNVIPNQDQPKEAACHILDSSTPATDKSPKLSDALNIAVEVDSQDEVRIPSDENLSCIDSSILITSDHETAVLPGQNSDIARSSKENALDKEQVSLNQQFDVNPGFELISMQNDHEDKERLCQSSDTCINKKSIDSYDKAVFSPAKSFIIDSSAQIMSNITESVDQNVDFENKAAEKESSGKTIEFNPKTQKKDLVISSDQCLGINGSFAQVLEYDKSKSFQTSNTNESPLDRTKHDALTMPISGGSNLNDSSVELPDQKDGSLKVVCSDDSLSNKEILKGIDQTLQSNNNKSLDNEQDEINDCQNVKIISVQDSLRSNQHLNTETFPLHCLVEAALALENVDSKRRLLKNASFSELFCESSGQLQKPPENEKPLGNNIETPERNNLLTSKNTSVIHEVKICSPDSLTHADREIFSKFEETNYNLRASTRIVTSSSSNIIPYSKRKYGLKSSKLPNTPSEKQKKNETSAAEKSRTKKRRGCFTYPRSKRRKRVMKEKPKCQQLPVLFDDPGTAETDKDCKVLENFFEKKNIVEEKVADNQAIAKTVQNTPGIKKCLNLQSESNEENNISQTAFGGPLIIASENPATQGNIFCVRVNSDKMDEYVNNINLGELEMLSDNGQTVFNDSISDGETDVPNMTLENGTSLVIIIEELDGAGKSLCEDSNKIESDIILGSIGGSVSCSEMLSTEFSVNESCICPPDFGIHGNSGNKTLTEKQVSILENEHFMQKTAFELNIEDSYEKYSASCHQELLTTNCYEELNENLVNDIGNWPFVEEEVAEFETNTELPNKIPEEGRKIELKCSLPWKKIFNMSKTKKKKSKTPRKVSGLELGPAKVEVRLKAPSAEWKVISDYHENSSPVVKVRRLILQRDSDGSSYSEKDSEEENENKRRSSHSSVDSEPTSKELESNDHEVRNVVSNNENWQPVVLLTRDKELDELTLSLDPKLHSLKASPTYIPQSKDDAEGKIEETLEKELNRDDFQVIDKNENFQEVENDNHFQDDIRRKNSRNSLSESETPESIKDPEHLVDSFSSQSSASSPSSHASENKSVVDSSEYLVEYKSYRNGKTDRVQVYETYSPSGCNNTLTNETVYSPSDPHYSPDPEYKDFDCRSSSGDTSCNNISSDDDDVFMNNVELFQPVYVEAKDTLGEANVLEEINLVANTFNQLEEDQNKIADAHKMLDNMISSHHNYVSNTYSPTESDTKHCFAMVGNSVEENGALSLLQSYKEDVNKVAEQNTEHFLGGENTETHSSDSSKQIILDQKKKSKRKMPKNFFVRKKLRKNKGDCDSTDEKSNLEEENNSQKSEVEVFSLCQDTQPGPLASVVSEVAVMSSPLRSSLSETQSRKSSFLSDDFVNTESDLSLVCENSRLQCVYNEEESSPVRLSDTPRTERLEVKQRLRDGGRGLKRPCEGHSKEDTKRRRKKLKRSSSRCQECEIDFQNKEELSRHNAYQHARRRELHHCLLCQRSFSSAVRHSLHVRGRSHRHLELTQRHTMHAMHSLLVGGQYPHIPPLSRAELRALQWRPSQPGYTHFYHDLTPLQAALQEHNTDVSEDTLSEELTPND